jgi:chaperonin cofactor prefoldin
MSEIKGTSFRVNEDDLKKFKEYMKEFNLTQAETFQAIINSFEMAKAKNLITDRAKEIEVFQSTVNNLTSMFISSLAINQTSEERIRESLSVELTTKDKLISNLQEDNDKYKDKIKALSNSVKEYENTINEINSNLYKSNKDNEDKTLTINNQLEQIKTLNEIVAEYKEYKDTNKVLVHSNKELTKSNKDLVHENLDLKDKISNIKDMNKFYKEQILKLEEEVRKSNSENNNNKDKYEKEIELLKNTQNKNLDDIKLESKARLEEKEKDFKDRLELEKEKFQLEVEKINNQYELLEIKYEELKEEYSQNFNNK